MCKDSKHAVISQELSKREQEINDTLLNVRGDFKDCGMRTYIDEQGFVRINIFYTGEWLNSERSKALLTRMGYDPDQKIKQANKSIHAACFWNKVMRLITGRDKLKDKPCNK